MNQRDHREFMQIERGVWVLVIGWVLWGGCVIWAQGGAAIPSDDSRDPVGRVAADAATSLRLPLSEQMSYEIPAAVGVTTTLSFPEAVNDLHGAGFTRDPESVGGDFEVQARPGESYISVTPLADGAKRNLNVMLQGGRIVAIRFDAGQGGTGAPLTVFFENPVVSVSPPEHPRISKTRKSPPNPFESSGAARILGALDTMKLLMALPGDVELRQAMDLMPGARLSVRDGELIDYGTHAVVLDRVLRLDDKDILVFAIRVLNRSDADIVVDPEGFLIRVGEQLYQQVTADIAPRIPRGEGVFAFVAIIGSPDGTPNWLDPENDFRISVALLRSGRPLGDRQNQESGQRQGPGGVAGGTVSSVRPGPGATPAPQADDSSAVAEKESSAVVTRPVAFVPGELPRPNLEEGVATTATTTLDSSPQSIPIQAMPEVVPTAAGDGAGAPIASKPEPTPGMTQILSGGDAVSIDEQISIRIAE